MVNILKGTNCYTIGNLQFGNFGFANQWRDQVKAELSPFGINVISPLDKFLWNYPKEDEGFQLDMMECIKRRDYDTVQKNMKDIVRRDLSACDYSTFLIAVIDTTKHTVGSYDEIFTALENRKPIFFYFLGDKEGLLNVPLWIWGRVPYEFFYTSLEDIIEDIKLINGGKLEIDRKYWKIFKQN